MFYIFVGVFLILLFFYFKHSLSYWERRKVPGPKPWPIVGNIGSHLMLRKTLGQCYHDIYRQYKGYPFVGVFRATLPVLLVRDPDLVTRVLVKDFKSFRNNEFYLDKESDPLFSRNPFILRDQEWKETRQMLTPGMTSGRMKLMYHVLKDVVKNFIKFVENHPTATTDGIETRGLTKRLTLDYVAKSAFGIDGKSFESYDEISEFNKLANSFLNPGSLLSVLLAIANVFPAILKYVGFKFVSGETQNKLMEIVSEVVKYRRDNNILANDYLQFLIQLAKDRNFGDVEITAHACTFFIDGYETSSLAMTWLLLNLAMNPEYQEKIRQDIKKYEKENNGELTYEAIHEMPWLNACFYESFRQTPPVDFLSKVCTEPFEYSPTNPDFKELIVKLIPGDIVVVPYGMLSKDPKYFDNPDKFMPERMMEKDEFDKSVFFPFSEGPRACIGQRLGVMMVKLGVANILRHFELTVSPKLKQPLEYIPYHPLNEIKGGFWIRYKKINA